MARLVNRLNNSSVRSLGEGEWLDGGGLYLVVGPGGSRSWIFRYRHDKARRRMGLGPFPTIGLAEARAKATEARKLLVEGVDPLQRRTKGGTTFEAFANRWLDQVELSHIIGDKAEQAYRRGDALERRRALMGEWGAYLG